jgi:hypothetical protein
MTVNMQLVAERSKNINDYIENVCAIMVAVTKKPSIMLQILNVVPHFVKVAQELWHRCVVKTRIAQVLEREHVSLSMLWVTTGGRGRDIQHGKRDDHSHPPSS